MPSPSIAQYLTTGLGLNQIIFRVPISTENSTGIGYAPYPQGSKTLQEILSENGSVGSALGAGELVSDTILHDAAVAGGWVADPYTVTSDDHDLVEYLLWDGAPVWASQTTLKLRAQVSPDPGHVARNAPAGLGVQPQVPGGQADPALKTIAALQDVLRTLGGYMVNNGMGVERLQDTPYYQNEALPLLEPPLFG